MYASGNFATDLSFGCFSRMKDIFMPKCLLELLNSRDLKDGDSMIRRRYCGNSPPAYTIKVSSDLDFSRAEARAVARTSNIEGRYGCQYGKSTVFFSKMS